MSTRKIVILLLVLLFSATAIYIVWHIVKSGSKLQPRPIDTKIESQGLYYRLFDKENRKTLEIWAEESKKGEKEKLLLKSVRAMIFKKGEMREDIEITAGQGSTTPNFAEFEISDGPKIHSPQLDLSGSRFRLLNMDILSTDRPARFRYEGMSGTVQRGLDLFFKVKDIRLHGVEGRLLIAGKEYTHKEDEFILYHHDATIVMDKVEYFKSSDSQLSASRIYIMSTPDLKLLKRIVTVDGSHLVMESRGSDGEIQERVIDCDISESYYDAQGRLEKMEMKVSPAMPEVKAVFSKGRKRTDISSSYIVLFFDPASGQLQLVETHMAQIDQSGREQFRVFSQRAFLKMDTKAEIETYRGEHDCRLEWRDVKCFSLYAIFNNSKSLFWLNGDAVRPAQVMREGNLFVAEGFEIDTRRRVLSSQRGVTATLAPRPEKGKLFQDKPAYVTAGQMALNERQNDLHFQQNVVLRQEETQIHGDSLRLATKDQQQLLQISGRASLQLSSDGERFQLQADAIEVFCDERRIEMTGGSRLTKLGAAAQKLSAGRIKIQIGTDDRIRFINAWENVQFSGEEIEGRSKEFTWNYVSGLAFFRKSGSLTQKGIKTEGEELQVNLKENEIVGRPRKSPR